MAKKVILTIILIFVFASQIGCSREQNKEDTEILKTQDSIDYRLYIIDETKP